MLARSLAYSLDPALFADDCGLVLDPWQANLLQTRPPRSILNCSRQSGKSTTVAVMALEAALHEPDSLIILCSPSQRQSGELLRKIKSQYARLAEHSKPPELSSEHALRLEFRNNSRILALPGANDGATLRGLSAPRMIVFDEASRCSDELFTACRPMLATSRNGQMILLSTPNGRRGFYFQIWSNNDPAWHRVRVPASMCPRISREFLAEERAELGELMYQQEYELAFVDDATAAFNSAIVDKCFSEEVAPLW